MDTVTRFASRLKPQKKQSEDGRDQWPSRTAFILAAAGGAIGQGNIIRFPSQVFNNIGLQVGSPEDYLPQIADTRPPQWFVPYLLAIFVRFASSTETSC